MFNVSYSSRLKRDLTRWVAKGWILPENSKAILADAEKGAMTNRFPAIIGMLGAILLAVGVILFVSANWQEMSKLSRLLVLFAAMWASFAAAMWLKTTSHDYLLEGMLFISAAIFGANIMLVAQIYHLDGHYPDAVMLWALGALLVAVLLQSVSAMVMVFGLLMVWTGAEVWDFKSGGLQVEFWPVWLIAGYISVSRNWRIGMHGALLSLAFWLVANGDRLQQLFGLSDFHMLVMVLIFSLLLFVGAMTFEQRRLQWFFGFETAIMRYGLIAFLMVGVIIQFDMRHLHQSAMTSPGAAMVTIVVSLVIVGLLAFHGHRRGVLQLVDVAVLAGLAIWFGGLWGTAPFAEFWLHAAMLFAVFVWLIGLGQRREDNFMVGLGLLAFGIEVLYLYAETLGTLLDTSLFFLIGGVLLIVLAFGLEMLRRRLSRDNGDEVVS